MRMQNRFQNYSAEADRIARAALGISRREARNFSITAALSAMAKGQPLRGYEAEVEQENVRVYGPAVQQNAIRIPTGMVTYKRNLTSAGTSGSQHLVGTDNLAGNFIDLLRNRLVCARMGATMLTGLRGNVTIPKQTAAATAHWLTNEATAISESQMTIGQLAMTPKTVGAYSEISRQLLLQGSPAADALVMEDLAQTIAVAIDAAAIAGTGADGQPTGIINTAGIGSVTGTSLGYAGVLEFMTDLANAMDGDKLGFVTTPAVAALLAQRVKVAATDSMIWEGNLMEGGICGMPAMSSNQMPAASMLFADWAQLLIGEWGILEIATNPAANFQAGIVGVRALQSVDIGVRQPSAFSLATSIT